MSSIVRAEDSGSLVGRQVRIDIDHRAKENIFLFIHYHHNETQHITGRLTSLDATSLSIVSRDSVMTLQRSKIKKICLPNGRRRAWPEGVGYGLVVSLLFDLVAIAPDNDTGHSRLRGDELGNAIAINTAVCAVTGGIIGCLFKKDKWAEIGAESWSIDSRTNAAHAGIGVAIALRF